MGKYHWVRRVCLCKKRNFLKNQKSLSLSDDGLSLSLFCWEGDIQKSAIMADLLVLSHTHSLVRNWRLFKVNAKLWCQIYILNSTNSPLADLTVHRTSLYYVIWVFSLNTTLSISSFLIHLIVTPSSNRYNIDILNVSFRFYRVRMPLPLRPEMVKAFTKVSL